VGANIDNRADSANTQRMPIYTCTTAESTLTGPTKAALAAEIARIHSEINHVPSTYVNVVIHELPADNVYTDGKPASPVLVSGWIREGHPKAETTRLATEIASCVTRITDIPAERVLVVFESSPASFAVEGGRVLPEPGQEEAWIAGH
jgi:phenylpyruvate tautomerase PptA (4-oxalocrotonate tautomerase family)